MIFRLFTILAVVALAVSTWLLTSPTRHPRRETGGLGAELPGYYLKNAVLTDFDANGNAGVRIEAQRIDQVDHSPEVVLHDVKVEYQSPAGPIWTLLGDEGHVETGSKVIDVTGNVRLSGDPDGHGGNAVIQTDTLSYDADNQIATTASDVRVDFGKYNLTARGLRANLKDRTLRLESKVNGRFHP